MKSMATCWYPFRSKEVKEIYKNMTPEEADRLKSYSWKAGSKMGAMIPMCIIPFIYYSTTYQSLGFLTSLSVCVILAALIGFIIGSPIRKKAKEILCETAHAKRMGFTPDNLRLYCFESDKKKAEQGAAP